MSTFTVKRSEWFRGKGSVESKLLREDGKRCCIGFVGQQCGFTDEQLRNVSSVSWTLFNADVRKEQWPSWMSERYGGDIQAAYGTNDDEKLTDEERETKLKEIFARNSDEIVFVD